MERDLAIRRLCRAATTALLAVQVLGAAGCSLLADERRQDVLDVNLAAFSTPPKGPMPEVVEIPMAEVEPPSVTEVTETQVLGDGETVTSKKELVTALDPATQKPTTQVTNRSVVQSVRVGQRWPVEGLVGQINGRPIFANDFFKVIEDRILLEASSPDQRAARQRIDAIVHQRFVEVVDSELVLAEAESRLSPEMKQGLLGWLRDLQEQAIAQRGGNRASAEEALRDEGSGTIEDYVNFTKNYQLQQDLLNRKVRPRVIVSWRDIERRYDKDRAMYAPDPSYKVARIRLFKDSQADKIEQVKKLLAEKRPFAEVAESVGMQNGGFWREVRVRDGKMDLGDLLDPVRSALEKLLPGMVSEPIDQRTSVMWLAIVGSDVPPSVSIFDGSLQLQLRGQLYGERFQVERAAYLQSLRRRWLSGSIAKMEERLKKMAPDRYLDPTKLR